MEENAKAGFWDYIHRLIHLQETGTKNENFRFFVYALVSFVIPFIFRQPQVVVGALVNMVLVLSALYIRGKRVFAIIILPGIAAIAGGYLFGEATTYLIYVLPFIWLGNALLVFFFKHFSIIKKQNFFLTLFIAAPLKALLIFMAAFVLFRFSIIPQSLLFAMGMLQLITALIGGTISFFVKKHSV